MSSETGTKGRDHHFISQMLYIYVCVCVCVCVCTYPCQIPRVDNSAWHRAEDNTCYLLKKWETSPENPLLPWYFSFQQLCLLSDRQLNIRHLSSSHLDWRVAEPRRALLTSRSAEGEGVETQSTGRQHSARRVDPEHPGPRDHRLPLPHTCVSLAPYPSSLSHPLSDGKWDCILLHSFSSLPSCDQYNHSLEATKLAKGAPS